MLATGGVLISIGLLTFTLLVRIFRRSDPPRWTTRGWVGEIVTIGLVSMLALGATCLIAGVIGMVRDGADLLQVALLALVVLLALVIGRKLRSNAQVAAGAAAPLPAGTPPAPGKVT